MVEPKGESPSDDLEDDLTLFESWRQQHGAVEADARIRRKYSDGSRAEIVIEEYHRRIGIPFAIPKGLLGGGGEAWYMPKPDHASPRWAYAKANLGLDGPEVEKISLAADEILARLADPTGEVIASRGLVVGHVQSGKTTSFLSVAAKALDNRYDLVIILSGVHNSLRRQTQDRAARTLVHNPSLWWLGTAVSDFKSDGNSLGSHLAGDAKRGLLVVKKHSGILRNLADWMEKESDASLRRLAILVIDDEADQAGLDVARGNQLEGVHRELSRIVNLQTSTGERRCSYLAYTATPYANILTSQAEFGLYPRDFIYPLDPPDSYVGIEKLFGDEQVGDPIQIEGDEGSSEILTKGLRDAIRWFILATAARVALGNELETFHSSMLIHTTQSTAQQIAYRPAIEEYLLEIEREFNASESAMKVFYEATLDQVPSRESNGPGWLAERTASWEEVRPHVTPVLRRLIERTPSGESFQEDGKIQQAHSGVIVDNSKVNPIDRLTYSDLATGQPSVTVIAIGGNTLSRGLTLEGLVCSYFARTARTYDSLMQMGRWFGYRPGYQHLLRIWTTEGLLGWFKELNVVEQDLRSELVWMQDQGIRPSQYGPRIRMSPYMNITRAAAMRSVQKEISYSDHAIDPAWLDLDPEVLGLNQEAARQLAKDLQVSSLSQSRIATQVPMAKVRAFLKTFQFHSQETRIDKSSLFRYFDKEEENLSKWNVLFKSNTVGNTSEFDYGSEVGTVSTVRRSRVRHAPVAFISSIRASDDHRLDLGGGDPSTGARYRSASEPPLLVLYAIDKTSTPDSRGDRVALNAESTPLSLAIFLPKSDTVVEYVTPIVVEIDQSIAELDTGDFESE